MALFSSLTVALALAVPAAADPSRVASIVANMTLDEKLGLLHGSTSDYTGATTAVDRLSVPRLLMNDGPQGFRTSAALAGTTTAFPSGLAIAATFDVKQAAAWGDAMGEEFAGKGANVQLGPGLNVARVPLNGRNFEYLSGEDPHLGATLVAAVVPEIQKHGVIANVKHFIGNNQETDRLGGDMVIQERALHELYLPPFEAAAEAGVLSAMCSYNRLTVNGVTAWACEHPYSLKTLENISKDIFVMSDWGATHSSKPSIEAGLDQEMPGSTYFGDAMKAKVQAGDVDEAVVDASVSRVLNAMDAVGLLDGVVEYGAIGDNVTSPAHAEVAKDIASNATVLLKNDGDVRGELSMLPLQSCDGLVIVGSTFETAGGGSGKVTSYAAPLSDALSAACGVDVPTFATLDDDDAKTAVAGAAAVVVLAGTTSSEGSDRDDLTLGDDDALVSAVAALSSNVVVSVSTPGAFLTPWSDDVQAILVTWMGGQELAYALADILLGVVSPAGRLPLTLPNIENEVGFTRDQYPGIEGDPVEGCDLPCLVANYTEGLYIGYRWYDANAVAPKYPFGHGLSYTSFAYADLVVDASSANVTVTNAGDVAGAEVAQLYLAPPAAAGEPPRQFKGFAKTAVLAPGASAVVTFAFDARSFAAWGDGGWAPVPGIYRVEVGASAGDVRVNGTVAV